MNHFLAAAVRALRLNRHFPPRAMAAGFLACFEDPPWDERTGLPTGTAWLSLEAERTAASQALERWASVDAMALAKPDQEALAARRRRLRTLIALPHLPRRQVQVRLRHYATALSSYEIVVDRFDPASCTLARYTIVLDDRPGVRLTSGELDVEVNEHFETALSLLDDQDAALAFAVLSEHVPRVESVTRGVLGPGVVRLPTGRFGPNDLDGLDLHGPVLSACLERASVDVVGGVVDDPLVDDVIVPKYQTDFGVSRRRKWAAGAKDVPTLRQWLASIDSRNLVYEVRHAN